MTTFLTILGLIVLSIMVIIGESNRRDSKRIRKTQRQGLERSQPFSIERIYRLRLNDGQIFGPVRIIGVTLGEWEKEGIYPIPKFLILGKPDGARAFVRPEAIRTYEEIKEADHE